MSAPTVLITRPAHQSHILAGELREIGIIPLVAPVLDVVPVPFEMPALYPETALIFTSANAVRVLNRTPYVDFMRETHTYAVGPSTRDALQEAGFTRIECAAGYARDIAARIRAQSAYENFVHVRGVHSAYDLQRDIEEKGYRYQSLIIYETVRVPGLSDAVQSALKDGAIDGVTLFSKRTAEIFITLLREHNLLTALKDISAFCLSDSMVESVRMQPWKDVHVCQAPHRASMLACLRRTFLPESNNE